MTTEEVIVKADRATDYVVLEQRELKDPDTDQVLVAWVEAGSAAGTRTSVVQQIAGDNEGVWRPVPVRSWQQAVRTRQETVTRIKTEPVEPF